MTYICIALNANFDNQKIIHPITGTYNEAIAPYNTIYAYREGGVITVISVVRFNFTAYGAHYFHSNGVNAMHLLNPGEKFGEQFSGGYIAMSESGQFTPNVNVSFSYDVSGNILTIVPDVSTSSIIKSTSYLTISQD